MCIVSAETVLPALATLAVFAALLAMLKLLKNRGLAFTPRVFTALGLGIALGVGIQLALGRGSDAALWALDWIAVVGQGYIALLKMLVMPLVFVAIVGAVSYTHLDVYKRQAAPPCPRTPEYTHTQRGPDARPQCH